MTSLKTKSICFLAAFLFLSIVPTLAEVVNTVQNCDQFLLLHNNQRILPEIPGVLVNGAIIQDQNHPNRYRVICQTFNNVRRFLTVYDTVNRIPVFSAYEYTGSVPGRCEVTWMVEPQLENGANPNEINMRAGGHNIINNQAVNADYDNQSNNQNNKRKATLYDKGHLFPVSHAPDYVDQISTLTLTNAVPQENNFNRVRWMRMEGNMRDTMNDQINNGRRCFVVVGAIPGNNNLNNRVNIPSRMWSAFYCTNQVQVRSGAYWDDNVAGANPLTERTLQALRNTLVIDPFYGAP